MAGLVDLVYLVRLVGRIGGLPEKPKRPDRREKRSTAEVWLVVQVLCGQEGDLIRRRRLTDSRQGHTFTIQHVERFLNTGDLA